jgi:hypothetical protein
MARWYRVEGEPHLDGRCKAPTALLTASMNADVVRACDINPLAQLIVRLGDVAFELLAHMLARFGLRKVCPA